MKPNSDTIKAAVASYFRYTRQCPLVAFECSARLLFGGELAEYELECRILMED